MAMGFTGPTTTFKKTPPYFWFCHPCHRSSSFPMAASSRSFWASSKSHKKLCRWQVQNFDNTKDRLLNVTVVCSSFRFNSRSNFNTMSFDESGSYTNMEHNQPFTDASFYGDLKRGNSYASVLPHAIKKGSPGGSCVTSMLDTQPFSGYSLCVVNDGGNSYARMLPRGIKQGVPRNTCITPSSDAHPSTPFQNKDFQPQSWYQEIQEMEKMKRETCLEMSLPIPNVQKAEYIVSEPCKPEAQDGSAFAKFPNQAPNGHARTGALGKSKASSATHNKATNKQHKYKIRGESKDLKKKQSSLQAMPVNGVQCSDLQLRNHVVEKEYENSVSNAEDSKETYIVPLDSRDCTNNNILRERLNSIYDKVLVIDNISTAKEVVRKLTNQYRDLVHACDTEVAAIDVKQETPVDHGEVICFSIYSGHEAEFGNGKSCIWVDVIDGGKDLLEVFSPFFEDPSIKKVWHNYSFDNHVLENYGLKLSGFHADTMHMARLWDSSRRMSGGYSLEALTSDSKGIMSGANLGPNEELIGKVSMKTIFGRKKLKKDGSEGKVVVIPAVEELQRTEREPWVCYSALDSISTLKLYERLKTNLSNREWKLNGITKGTLFDFYEQYWRPFGELLVKMETEGMLVDRAYLAEIEKVATAEQQIAADRFRSWASKLCPDAKFMNVRSDAQLRQLFFGGIENRKDPAKSLPMENEFKVPNVDNIIEEGKKTATKFRKIKLKAICPGLETEMYTTSGWPSISGDVLKNLAGKVSMEYDFADVEDTELDENADDIPEVELSKTKRETPSNNSEASYGTAYAAFGGGSEGREACHAIAALCEVCSIDSLISNFILPLQGSHISGRNGRIHCSLNINTETGRLSARRPNLQNQPALEKDRYKIRQAFIAAPGNSLIVADYGQLELRILAHLANCKSMLDAFKAGGDFHSRTAMNMYPYIRDAVDSKEVLLEWHPRPGQESPPVPLLKDMFGSERRKAKMLNFSIAYGKTAVGLSRDWKVSVDEAKETVARWYRGREEVLKWQEARKREARSIGCVYTLLGRARTFPSTKNATGSQKGHIERAAINTPVQGSAADVAMCAMLEISKNARLKELGWRLLLQVHDEVILEGPTDSAEVAKAIVVECMSKPFDGKNILKVDLSVDAKFAKNWYSAK